MKKVALSLAVIATLALVSCGNKKAAETTVDSDSIKAAEAAALVQEDTNTVKEDTNTVKVDSNATAQEENKTAETTK